jgi:hypothetical protein
MLMGRGLLLGLGALALSTRSTSAQTAFTSYSFAATGATTSRTEPDRWADWYNVKDFGATGNGSTDDTGAIQLAINAITSPRLGQAYTNQGVVFFPPGTYRVSSRISIQQSSSISNGSIILAGSGLATTIAGNFADYVFAHASNTGGFLCNFAIRDMTISNGNANGGGILLQNCCVGECRNLAIGANIGINADSGNSAYSIKITNCVIGTGTGGTPQGSVGIYLPGGLMDSSQVSGFDTAVHVGQAGGCEIVACRFEVNRTAILIGQDPTGADAASANLRIAASSFEGNTTGINITHANALVLESISIQGSAAAPGGQSQYGILFKNCQCSANGVNLSGSFSATGIQFVGGMSVNLSNVTSPSWNYGGQNMSGCTFVNCNQPTAGLLVTFGNAPTSPTLGQKCWFSDSNTSVFRSAIAGGGSNQVMGRWNGANWTVAA